MFSPGYILNYKHESEEWQTIDIAADASSYTLKELRCGSLYHLYLSAYNRVGTGSPSDVLSVSTKGSGRKPRSYTLFPDIANN